MKTPVLKIHVWQRTFAPRHDDALFEAILSRHLIDWKERGHPEKQVSSS